MKYRIVNKGRFITIMAVVMFLIIAGLSVNKAERRIEEVDTHIVSAGENLWSICKEYKGDMDLREYIFEVQKYNNCSANLQVGQEITLIKIDK